MAADGETDLELARSLAREAISLCERLGHHVAAAHLQLGLDLIDEAPRRSSLRDHRAPWPDSE